MKKWLLKDYGMTFDMTLEYSKNDSKNTFKCFLNDFLESLDDS